METLEKKYPLGKNGPSFAGLFCVRLHTYPSFKGVKGQLTGLYNPLLLWQQAAQVQVYNFRCNPGPRLLLLRDSSPKYFTADEHHGRLGPAFSDFWDLHLHALLEFFMFFSSRAYYARDREKGGFAAALHVAPTFKFQRHGILLSCLYIPITGILPIRHL